MIKIIAQFHFANLFGSLKVYYAHPKAKYIDSIEKKEMKVIYDYFPFAEICNPSKLEPIWKENNCSEKEIMEHCLDLVSQSDLVIFSPFDDSFIGKGVYEEVSQAEDLNVPVYIVYDDKIQDYELGNENEQDWQKFCAYKPISLIKEELFITVNNPEIEKFLKKNKSEIEKNVINKHKKYIFVCNNTAQLSSDFKKLSLEFKDSNLKILPIIGKAPLCNSVHINDSCESNKSEVEVKNFPIFENLTENISRGYNSGIISAIKNSTPKNVCPYLLLYKFV